MYASEDYKQKLRVMGMLEVFGRSKTSAFSFLFCWVLIVLSGRLYDEYLVLSIVHSLAFIIFGCLGIIFRKYGEYYVDKYPMYLFSIFVSFVLMLALWWGILSAYVSYVLDLSSMRTPILIITAVIASLGVTNAPISKRACLGYIGFLCFPTIIMSLYHGSNESKLVGVFYSVIVFALYRSVLITRNRFWDFLKSQVSLEDKASTYEELSQRDGLTKLYNRFYFDRHFSQEWTHAINQKHSLAVVMVDVDFFKRINDDFGHQAGDACLKHIANLLTGFVRRSGDFICRYGGEEFVIIFPHMDESHLESLVDAMVTRVRDEPCLYNGKSIPLTISIGIALMGVDYVVGRDDLLGVADKALYDVKAQGRDGYKPVPAEKYTN